VARLPSSSVAVSGCGVRGHVTLILLQCFLVCFGWVFLRCADPRPAHPCVAPLPYWPPPDVQRRPVAVPCPSQWAACPCWRPPWARCTPPSAGCSSTPTPPPSHDPCVDRRTWVRADKLPLHLATLLPRPGFPLPCCSDASPSPRLFQLAQSLYASMRVFLVACSHTGLSLVLVWCVVFCCALSYSRHHCRVCSTWS
jgi:hypothetical protein